MKIRKHTAPASSSTSSDLQTITIEKERMERELSVMTRQLAKTAHEKEVLKCEHDVVKREIDELLQKFETIKSKYEAILSCIGDGLVVVDSDGKVNYSNISFEKLFGWKSREIIGKSIIQVLPQEDADGNQISFNDRTLTRVLTGKKSGDVSLNSLYYVGKNKSRLLVKSTITPVIIQKKILGAVLLFRDITKEAEIDTAKTEFVALTSHQLRTPLSTVNWYSEMLLAGDVGTVTPDQKQYLEEIYYGNQRMIDLVNTLLDVSRIELGTFEIESKKTDVALLVQSAVDEHKLLIKKKKIIFSSTLEKDIPLLHTDPKLLQIVFQNLLSNAITYTPDKGSVTISLSKYKKKSIIFKITDTGYGIPKGQKHKIFTKLFRGDNIIGKNTEGTGLGLYMAKSIIEKSGGELWFESIEDTGTTFYATLPLEKRRKKRP